jgi:hypothetical protein
MIAKSDPNYPSAQAIWLHEKIPGPLLLITIIAAPIFLYLFFGGIYVARFDLVMTALIFGAAWLFLYAFNRGAKLAWDEDRIYMRHAGWAPTWRFPWIRNLIWRSLAYHEIARIDDLTFNDPAAKSFLLPFQLLRLSPSTSDEINDDDIWFYSLAIRDKELAPLLRHIDAKCPGMLPEIVQQRLEKWADNDRP